MLVRQLFLGERAISKITALLVIVVVLVAAVVGGFFVYYSSNNNSSSSSGTYQFEDNNSHVYNYSMEGTVASFNTTVNGGVIVPPTVYNGVLLVDFSTMKSTAGGVTAIDLRTGQTLWTATVPNLMMTQPLTYSGLVIIGLGSNLYRKGTPELVRGNGTNYVEALNFSTGQTVWTFPTLGEDMPTPVIHNGLVIFPNGNGVVYALNVLTGQSVWNATLSVGSVVSMSCPAITGNLIYFGQSNPYSFDCVNLSDGQVVWTTAFPAAVGGLDDCSPVVWNGVVISGYTVYASNGLVQPILFGIDEMTGQVLWQVKENVGIYPAGGEWFTPVTVWNGIVYSDSPENGTLYAVNAKDGSVLWTFPTGSATSNVNVFNGYLWIVSSATFYGPAALFVLNPSTGTLVTAASTGQGLGNGNLVFVNQNVIFWGNSGEVASMPVADIHLTLGNWTI